MTVSEYEILLFQLVRHATTIILIETEMVHWFVRELTHPIRQTRFRMSRDGAYFQSVVSTTKDAELVHRKEFGDPKKVCYQNNSWVPHQEAKI